MQRRLNGIENYKLTTQSGILPKVILEYKILRKLWLFIYLVLLYKCGHEHDKI